MNERIRAPSVPRPLPARPETIRRRSAASHTDAQATTRVFVRGLIVDDASIGVHAHEKTSRQRLLIDIALDLGDLSPPAHDRLAETVDYQAVAEAATRLAREGHVQLVETLADRIARWCLAHDPRVIAATVRLEKPDALPDAAAVGCEMTRRR